ncbi:MAG: Ig-like domain-containing protein [Bifidobacteriaceae bacterium]|jgi:hypothetical protein|nr:Ig-like domain-containing protein [Bifidobacteriaceae bacterium]
MRKHWLKRRTGAAALAALIAVVMIPGGPASATDPIVPGNEGDVGIYTNGAAHAQDIGDPAYTNTAAVEALLDPAVQWTADSMYDSIFAQDVANFDANLALGKAPFYLDRVLGYQGDNSGLRILQTRGRTLYMRGTNTNTATMGFPGTAYAGGATSLGALYTVTTPNNAATEVAAANRFNAPSYFSDQYNVGSLGVAAAMKKFITYDNVAVTTIAFTNNSAAEQTFTVRAGGSTVATRTTAEPDELIGTRDLASGSGNLNVATTWGTATIHIKAPGFTVNGTNLDRELTIPAGETVEVLVAASLYTNDLPESKAALYEYAALTPAAAFKQATTEFNARWAADIPYIDVPSPAIEKAILYRWWGERYNSLDANESGYEYQYPVTIEGVNLYQNAIVLTQPMHLQDTKWQRTPYLPYGQILNVGELSGSSAFLDSPGYSSWNNHYSQYIGTAGLEAYYVHGGGTEIAERFATYFEGDGVGQLEHYDGNDNNLIAYTANYMPGNDADALTFGYPKAGTSTAGSSNIERPESAYVWGDFDAAAKLYAIAGGDPDKIAELNAKADDIKTAIEDNLWSDTMKMFLAQTTRGRTAATSANGNANPLAATEPTLIPAKESNLYDIYAQNLLDPEDADKYVDGFRFLTYGDNIPIFPFYTANQYDRTRYGIGGSNNFSNINFTVQYRGVRSALRYYDPDQKYITPEYAAQLLDWMAWSIYLNSGNLLQVNQAEYYSNWNSSAKTYNRNNPYHVMLGNMNYIYVEDMGGIQPRADDVIELWPIDLGNEYFMVNNLRYHGQDVTIVWDEDGSRYGLGAGYSLFIDGEKKVTSSTLGRLTYNPNTNEAVAGEDANITFVDDEGASLPTAKDTPIEDERVVTYLKTAGIDLTSAEPNLALEATVSSSTMQTTIPTSGRRAFHTPGYASSSMNYDPGSISEQERPASLAAVNDGSTVNEPYWGNYGVAEQSGWVELDFGSDQTFDNVKVFFAETGLSGGSKAPQKYVIRYYDEDSSAWKAIPDQARLPKVPQPKTNEALFPAITTDKIRVFFDNATSAFTAITEIQVFNSGRDIPVVVNEPPVITASVDATKNGNLSTDLVATVSDDGLPEDAGLTTTWEVVSKPEGATVILSAANALTTRIVASTAGAYEVKFTANDGALAVSQSVAVNLTALGSTDIEWGAQGTISTRSVASWENVNMINAASTPSRSNAGTGNGWGTWGTAGSGTSQSSAAWVQYSWAAPVYLKSSDIYWYDDGGGTRIPTATGWAIEYSNDGETWTPVTLTGATNYDTGRVLSQYNHFDLAPIKAQHIRVRIWALSGSGAGTGILRWRVNGPAITAIDGPQMVRTVIGQIPTLPSEIGGAYSDGAPGTVQVVWNPITAADVAEANVEPLAVYGANGAYGLISQADVYVRPDMGEEGIVISSVAAMSGTTGAGDPPTLPATATVLYNDGSQDNLSIGINWDEYDQVILCQPGPHQLTGALVLPSYVSTVGAPPVVYDLTVTSQPAACVASVGPAGASVYRGGSLAFIAAVLTLEDASDQVTWSVADGSPGTSISAEGLLTVAPDETPRTLTVTATSAYDPTKSASTAVVVLVDKSGLADAVSQAGGFSIADYTASSWAGLVAAVAAANAVLADDDATQGEVDEATVELFEAIDALVEVDRVAPAPPTVSTPVNGARFKTANPVFTGTAEAGSTVRVTTTVAPTKVLCRGVADELGKWSCAASPALAEGEYKVSMRAKDAAGNESGASTSRTFTVDLSAPANPVITKPANGSAVASAQPEFTGTAEVGSTVRVTEGSSVLCTGVANALGVWACSPTAALTEAEHRVSARAKDSAGNESGASLSKAFTVDVTTPDKPRLTLPTANAVVAGTVTFAGTAEAGARVRVSTTTAPVTVLCMVYADSAGQWSCQVSDLAVAWYQVSARARDAAGNESGPSTGRSFVVTE